MSLRSTADRNSGKIRSFAPQLPDLREAALFLYPDPLKILHSHHPKIKLIKKHTTATL